MPDSKVDSPVADVVAMVVDAAVAGGTPVAASALALARMALPGFLERIGQTRAEQAVQALTDAWAAVGRLPPDAAHREIRRLLLEGDLESDDALHETFRHMNASRHLASWP